MKVNPSFWCYKAICLSDLHHATCGDYCDVLVFNNEPHCFFAVVGVITRVEQRAKCVHYFVEDLSSRGGITCIAWKKKKRLRKFDNGSQEDTDGESEDVAPGQDVDMHTFHLNDLVKINGKLSVYRNDRQLTIHKMIKIEEENEESLWHLRILQQEKRT